MLSLQIALETIEKGEEFSIEFVTANLSRGTGGEIRKIARAIVPVQASKSPLAKQNLKRPPNHFTNSTLNLTDLITDRIIKVHKRLIIKFNGHTVTY